MTMYAVMKGKRMVEPAFRTRQEADDVCAAYLRYSKGYVVRIVEVIL